MLDSDGLLVWKHVGNETARLTIRQQFCDLARCLGIPRKQPKPEPEGCTCLSSPNMLNAPCQHCEERAKQKQAGSSGEGLKADPLTHAQAEPVAAKEPWKPVVGQKVLVEAAVIKLKPERDGYADVEITDHYYYADSGEASDLEDPNRIRLPLSQLRPLPVVQGEKSW